MWLQPEGISALSAVVAVIIAGAAASIGLSTFREQRVTAEVQLALSIFSEINRYWDRLTEHPEQYDYNIGQVLAHFEIAAALFNRKSLSANASVILGDHIVEVFSSIQSSDDGKRLLEKMSSAESTFCELRSFARHRMPQALATMAFRTKLK